MNLEKIIRSFFYRRIKKLKTNKTRINGSGSIGAGTYKDISISGSGSISGDIECEKLDVSGICKSAGTIHANEIYINGSFKAEDAIKSKTIEVNGSLKVEGDIKTDTFNVNGSVKTSDYNVYAEYLEINGSLSNEKELNADKIIVNGKIKVNEIVGTNIEILKYGLSLDVGNFFRFSSKSKLANKAESITCETIYAKFLKCNKICAENITLKSDCTVEFIECNGTLFIGKNCHVSNIEGDCEIVRE